ncbi:MAG: hypothetical protein JSS63_02345 [Bacteroidetes bacterium]|nr:hypothetical protein [Bacteroidota bacterium]MBX7046668.1 hypothetical protein [Ignavibacteria bacterium]
MKRKTKEGTMGTAYNIYKHEAKDYTKFQLVLYSIFFLIIFVVMLMTVFSFRTL